MQPCELCGGAASLHCEADQAFLCWSCDAAVHGANFLVARLVRLVACTVCRSVVSRRLVSGPGLPPFASTCHSCSPASSASSCLTAEPSTEPPVTSRRAWPAVPETAASLALQSLCGRMGMQRLEAAAAKAMGACGDAIDGLPRRVAVAAALWHAIKLFARRERSARSGVDDALRRHARACPLGLSWSPSQNSPAPMPAADR